MQISLIIRALLTYYILIFIKYFVNSTETMSDIVTEQQTSLVPVKLDIRKKQGTEQFDYYRVGDIWKYTPRGNYAFGSVKQCKGSFSFTGNDIDIWKAKDKSEFATKVVVRGVGSKTKFMTVYLLNGQTKLFAKDKNIPWTEFKGKIPVELDIRTIYTTNEFLYSFDTTRKISTYIAKCFFAFSLVKQSKLLLSQDSLVIWKAKNKSEFATKVVVRGVGSKTKFMTVYLLNGQTKLFAKDKNIPWTEFKGRIPLQIYIGYKQSDHCVDYSFDPYSNTGIYTPKFNHVFRLVKTWKPGIFSGKDIVIWEAKDKTEYANKVIVDGIGFKTKHLRIHMINGENKHFAKDKNNPWTDYKDKVAIEFGIGYRHTDKYLNYYENNFENDYTYTNTEIYTAKAKYAFSLVKQWKFLINCIGQHVVIWKAKNNNEYSYKVVVFNVDYKPKFVKVYLLNGETKLFGKDKNIPWTEFKGRIPIEIYIGYKQSDEYLNFYTEYFTSTGTYIPKDNFTFSEIKQLKRSGIFGRKGIVIWKAKDKNEYSNKVVVNGVRLKIKYVTVYMVNGQTKVFHKHDINPWKEHIGKIPVELDLNFKESNRFRNYSFDKVTKTDTYTPRGNYAFGSVKQCKVSFSFTGNDIDIWKAKDKYGYATKVVVSGVGFKKKSLTITLLNSQTKVFAKDENTPWHEVTDDSKPLVPTPVKPTKPSTPLLPLTEDTTQPEITEVYVPDSLPQTPLFLPSPFPVSSKPDYSITPEHTAPVSPGVTYIEIDISKKRSTNEYEYKKHGDNHVFTANSGFLFSKVMDGPIERWESDGTKYAMVLRAREGKDGFFRLGVTTVKIDELDCVQPETQPSSTNITVPSPTFPRRPSVSSLDSDVSVFDDDGTIEQVESIMIHHNLRLAGQFTSLSSPRFESELDSEFEDDGTFPLLLSQLDCMQQPLSQVPSQLHTTPLHSYQFHPNNTVLVTC